MPWESFWSRVSDLLRNFAFAKFEAEKMKIKFKSKQEIDREDLVKLAVDLGFEFPEAITQYFTRYNGAEPDPNIYELAGDGQCSVNSLIPAKEVLKERKLLGYVDEKIIPIAHAEGGNYVIVDLDSNSEVFFWDHEYPNSVLKLADNVDFFLENLEPFDIKSVELKEDQIESAWIDPDFLATLK